MDYFFTEEQQMIKDTAAQIAKEKIEPIALEYDEEGKFPWDIVKILGDADLFRVFIPEEYEGLGGGVVDMSMIRSRGISEPLGQPGSERRFVALAFPVGQKDATRHCVTVAVAHDSPILRDTGIAFLRLLAGLWVVHDQSRTVVRQRKS